jgi:ribosomal protein L29
MTAIEEKPHNHNHPELVDKVNELSEALFMLKASAEAGGLPDMHIENILKWYAWTTCDLTQQHEREKGIAEMNGAIGAIEALITLNGMLRQEPSTRQLHGQLERLKGKLTELQEVQNGSHSDNS